ncbi:MAG: ABC transporter permease [Phycisphaeraceae bacterium]|nr:ABC transporter permease [Phycisphaeraceae bacterium]
MLAYLGRRLVIMVLTLAVISVVAFVVIELPPGDFVSWRIEQMSERGMASQEEIDALRRRYGLDRSMAYRYVRWITRFVQGDMGHSLSWDQPVWTLFRSRFPMTVLITALSLLFTWALAIPIGILSAVRRYSVTDVVWTFVGFIGLATPNFLIALVFMYLSYEFFPDIEVGGLLSHRYVAAPWTAAKVLDLLGHLWIPVVIVGTAGTAGTMRVIRANLIDELRKPYVEMARAKGLSEARLIFRYPVRVAINPFLSTVGWVLPLLIAGETITAIVLGMPTAGPLFLQALLRQDMQVAGAYVMLVSALTLIGTRISDFLLVVADPRIRMEGSGEQGAEKAS